MSYSLWSRGIPPNGLFDYSRAVLPGSGELVEADLDETIGIQDSALQTWYGPPIDINGIDENGDGDFTDDWSLGQGIGSIDWNVNGNIEPSVATDINNMDISGCRSTPGETLLGFDDWSNLIYNFRDSEFFPVGHAPGARVGSWLAESSPPPAPNRKSVSRATRTRMIPSVDCESP